MSKYQLKCLSNNTERETLPVTKALQSSHAKQNLNEQYDIDKTGYLGQNSMTVTGVHSYNLPVGAGGGYFHLRCFPRVTQGFLLVLVSEARSPRAFPRHLFSDLLCCLFGLRYRGGSMEYVLWTDQLLIFFVKAVNLCKCSHHSYHCLVIFTLANIKKVV